MGILLEFSVMNLLSTFGFFGDDLMTVGLVRLVFGDDACEGNRGGGADIGMDVTEDSAASFLRS